MGDIILGSSSTLDIILTDSTMPFCDCIGKPDSFDLDILDCTHVIAMLKSLTI